MQEHQPQYAQLVEAVHSSLEAEEDARRAKRFQEAQERRQKEASLPRPPMRSMQQERKAR